MIETYRPSGRIGVLALPCLGLALVAALVLAFPYQLLLEWIPLIYANFLLTGAMAWVVGWLTQQVVRVARVRNVTAAILSALVLWSALIGAKFWFQARAYRQAVLAEIDDIAAQNPEVPRQLIEQELQKLGVWDYMEARAEIGWQIGRRANMPIKGPFVWLVWLIESGIIIALAGNMARRAARRPFQEELKLWADEEEVLALVPANDQSVAVVRSASVIDDLLAVPDPVPESQRRFLNYKMFSIPGYDREAAYLSIYDLVISQNKDGQDQKKEKPLWEFVNVSPVQRALLEETLDQMTSEESPDATEATEDSGQATDAPHEAPE